jgi:plasmid stability protein
MKRFTIDVSKELHSRIKVECARRGINMADELRKILEREFPVS